MAGKSKIECTGNTWNPIAGCSVVSPGCTNCYAMRMAARLEAMGQPLYSGLTKPSKAGPVWTGKVRVAGKNALLAPLRHRTPTTWFVNSMADLFHEGVPDEVIDRVFAVMALCPQQTFQVLTKRPARMRAYIAARPQAIWDRAALAIRPAALDQLKAAPWPLPNVWLGVSAEDQARADERISDLLATPAAVRFVSAEPLLGPIDLTCVRPDGFTVDALTGRGEHLLGFKSKTGRLDWIIVGGESGPGARPMNPQWARDIRDQCSSAGVAYFHKQNGEFASVSAVEGSGAHVTFSDGRTVRRVGKARAGRLLDGREHNAMPRAEARP